MKRKALLSLSLILLTCILISAPAFAGDVPESALLHADHCFIGIVEKVDGSVVTLKISEVVFGDYPGETADIQELKYTTANGKTSKPKKGDYCAVVVKQSQEGFQVYQGLAAKADSLDKKTLKLKSTTEFLKRMNQYINKGWYSNDNINRIKQRLKENEISSSITDRNNDTVKEPIEEAAETNTKTLGSAPAAHQTPGKQQYYVWIGAGAALVLAAGFIGVKTVVRIKGKRD